MPPRHKKQHASAPDKRHESGLIAPGKKISKDKHASQNGIINDSDDTNANKNNSISSSISSASSNSNSNNHNNNVSVANGSAYRLNANLHTASYPSSSPSGFAPSPPEDASLDQVSAAHLDMARSSKPIESGSPSIDETVDSSEAYDSFAPAADSNAERGRHSFANGAPASQPSNVASSSANIESVTTVIGPHSQWDVLAILMLLLQLPPFVLVLIQVSFAFMTFGNSSNLWTLFTFGSASDWFRSHGGNPSAVVSLVSDIAFTCAWLSLPFLKTFILDLAPAVVALSLGGGTAANDSWKHISLCFATVSVGHLFQARQRRQYFVNLLSTALSKLNLNHLLYVSPASVFPSSYHSTSRSWARIILELHIVSHGLVRVIRRGIDRSSHPQAQPHVTKGDPESASASTSVPVSVSSSSTPSSTSSSTNNTTTTTTTTNATTTTTAAAVTAATGSTSAPSSSANVVDSTSDGARSSSTDGRPPGQPPSSREKQISSGKKRRKQATLVRSQQPFWAAIGTTKIQVSKEIEQSNAERDYFEASAGNITTLGDASSNASDDCVWITNVGQTEVSFMVSLDKMAHKVSEADLSAGHSSSRRPSQDPLLVHVRINGAFWSSVETFLDCEEEDAEEKDEDEGGGGGGEQQRQHQRQEKEDRPDQISQFTSEIQGKIFGLAPSSMYFVEFVRPEEEVAIFSSAILTRQEESSAGQASSLSQQLQDPTRPSSPITTIKKSIEAADARLSDYKSRSNKARKGRQGTTRTLRQDVSDLSRTLASCGNNERQQQRQIQYKQNIKQAEEAAAELSAQIVELGEIPKDEQEALDASKSSWTEMDNRRQKLRKQTDAIKRQGQRKASEAHSENSRVRGKREKAESRLSSLTERRKTTAEENDAKRNAKTLSETQHAYKIDNYRLQEHQVIRDIQTWEGYRQELEAKAGQLGYQEPYFDSSSYSTNFQSGQPPVPRTPESLSSGLAGSGRPPSAAMNSPLGIAPYQMNTPPATVRGDSQRQRTRGRSSSMLSNISGFTDEETTPYTSAGAEIARNGSGSPRDAAGGLTSSQRASPAVTDGPRISPRQMKR